MQSNSFARNKTLLAAVLLASLCADGARANGNETLGDPALGGPPGPALVVGSGTQVITKGVGLLDGQPDSFMIDIPAGVTVVQVIAYWNGTTNTAAGHGDQDTITVNGGSVTGDRIGGPNFFFNNAYTQTYRAELASDFVTAGMSNMVTVSGLDFDRANNGFGLMVIVDDGVSTEELGLRDGNDNAFINFPEPRKSTIAQTFTFTPVAVDRVGTFSHFFSSVEAGRPTIIRVDIPGEPTQQLNDAIGDSDGHEWDSLTHDVNIPANASQVTIQVFSEDCCASGDLPASLVWLATAFHFPLIQDCDMDGIPDDQEPDCDMDGIPDDCEPDCDMDGVPDDCEPDCDADGIPDDCEADCDADGTPDDCEPDCDADGTPDDCEPDCDADGTPDDCEPDCDADGVPDDCEADNNGNGIPDDCERGGGEGCTPGFWKNRGLVIGAWTNYAPGDNFDATFGTSVFGTSTLLEVLRNRPDVVVENLELALGRHAVAAILNAANPNVEYDLDEADIIADVAAALNGGDLDVIEDLKDDLAGFNEQGSPICQ